jgi:hypothetical protein
VESGIPKRGGFALAAQSFIPEILHPNEDSAKGSIETQNFCLENLKEIALSCRY